MENETELIRDQMADTRTALTEKLDRLQEQVLGTVEGTTRSVTETVEAVQEAVQDTVGTVKESVQETVHTVKSAFDLTEQTEKHPWLMMGGAVLVGFIGGRLLMSPSRTALPPSSDGSAPRRPPARTEAVREAASSAASTAASAASATAGWLEELAAPLVKQAEGMALGVLAGVAADLIQEKAPEGLRGQLNEMVEKFTSTVGTTPIRGLFAGDKAAEGPADRAPQGGQSGAYTPAGRPGGFRPTSPAI
jgi:ElaB/YqjD/DUF883 family membrane-anchored ribosome-binding protein